MVQVAAACRHSAPWVRAGVVAGPDGLSKGCWWSVALSSDVEHDAGDRIGEETAPGATTGQRRSDRGGDGEGLATDALSQVA